MDAPALNPHLQFVAETLIARTNGSVDAEFVHDLVAGIARQFDDALVRDFVPVLVAKEASARLRELDATRLIAS
ncbi:MAG: hypothetical protein WCJ32_09485 [Actinomycetota bacterium]